MKSLPGSRRARRAAVAAVAALAATLLTAPGTATHASADAPGVADITAAPSTLDQSPVPAIDPAVDPAARPSRKLRLNVKRQVVTGSRITLQGTAPTRGTKRVVVLAERQGKRWVTRARKRTTKAGRYTFRVKAGTQVSARRFRVTAKSVRGFRKVAASRKVTVLLRTGVRPADVGKAPLLGGSATLAGTVTGRAPGGRTVVAQLSYAGGWSDAVTPTGDSVTAVTAEDGSYSLSLPTSWLYATQVRVRVLGTRRAVAATTVASTVSVRPTWTPGGLKRSWTFLAPSRGPKRMRWNPCTTTGITYRINLSQVPGSLGRARAERLIHQAVGEIGTGTGLSFVYLGQTDGVYAPAPGTPGQPRDTQIMIGWAAQNKVAMPFNPAIAWGGGDRARLATDSRGPVWQLETGGLVMDPSWPGWTPGTTLEVLMHELGHVMGLGHTPRDTDPVQVMFYSVTGSKQHWGAGDINGLRSVGRQAGCTRPVTARGLSSVEIDARLP